jgi:hypothetical protein
MNHKLIRMMEEAGFPFTPDTMYRMPEFENLVRLEREACAKVAEAWMIGIDDPQYQTDCATAIRARGQE